MTSPLPWAALALALLGSLPAPSTAQDRPVEWRLPTENQALFSGDGPAFYQFVDRTFEGEKSTPWEGGRFGFVRDPRRIGSHIGYARFHEGLDIKPLRRDPNGEPLDEVSAIAAGRVVHVANVPSQSNYGRYIVLQHDWGYGPFFSLYAHLNASQVGIGDSVKAGQTLGRLGYTGAGIDKRRAHLHVELNLLWSSKFQRWYDTAFTTPNHHGIYNGQNLIGLDLAAFFLAHQKNPSLNAADFVRQTPAYFEVTVPGTAEIELLKHYPWLLDGTNPTVSPAWKITFSAWGLPVRIQPSSTAVTTPTVTAVQESPLPHALNTRSLITGSGRSATLSPSGLSFIRLACGLP